MAKAESLDRGRVEINEQECKGCGLCVRACPPQVLRLSERLNSYGYHPVMYVGQGCTGCGACFYACPEPGAIIVFILQQPAREASSRDRAALAA